MNYQEFLKRLHEGTFLDRFQANELPWIQLVQTNVIEDWLRELEVDDPHRFNALKLVVWPVLLERHLLHLDSRVDPAKLERFWHWVCSSGKIETQNEQVKYLWKNHELSDAMQHSTPVEQEKAFCKALWGVAKKLESLKSLRWAYDVVAELAKNRDITQAVKPSVDVVFALKDHSAIPSLRSGLLVRFRLLAPTPDAAQVLIKPTVFAESFQSVLNDIQSRIDRVLRFMEHDVEFLGESVLEGKSGTFAFLMAQWLAARPSFNDQYGTLPPWVVISSEMNNETDETSPVGGLPEKVRLLAEHGVRYFIVASDPKVAKAPKGLLHRINLNGHQLLQCFSFHGTKNQIGNSLHDQALIRQADVSELQGKQLASITTEQAKRLAKLNQFRFVEFKLKNDFIPPSYAHAVLQQAIQKLPQRGYIHLVGEGGIGKTTLVESMRPGFTIKVPSSDPHSVGATIGHIVFRGTAENPTKFIEQILSDAQEHARSLEDEVTRAVFRTQLDILHREIIESQSPRPIQKSIADVVNCVRKNLVSVTTVILAIDGLDELTLRNSAELTMRIHELLPAPEQLNPGCYILLTSRPELRPEVQDAINQRKIDPSLFQSCELELNDRGYESIVHQYIQKKLGPAAAPHISAILIKAERRFVWVRLLVELIQLSRIDLAQTLPGKLELPNIGQMLPQYMEQLKNRVAAFDIKVVGWLRPVLMIIAAAYEPIARHHLHAWLADLAPVWSEDDSFHLDATLIAIQPLLYEDRVSHSEGTKYRIAHREIKDWLAENIELGWLGALRSEGHQRIASSGIRMGFLKPIESKKSLDHYHLLYLSTHLIEAGDVQGALSNFSDSEFRSAYNDWTKILDDRMDYGESIYTHTCAIDSSEKLISSLGVEEAVTEEQPKLAHALACDFTNRGRARNAQQDFAGAMKDYDRAIGLREKLISSLGGEEVVIQEKPKLANDLAITFMNRGNSRQAQQDFAGAVKDYKQTFGILEKLISSLGGEEAAIAVQPKLANLLASACTNSGSARQAQQDFAGAVKDFDRAIGLLEKLVSSLGGAEAVIAEQPKLATDLASTFMNRGNARHDQQDFVGATKDIDRAINILEKLVSSLGGEEVVIAGKPQLANELARTFMNRGATRLDQQDFAGAVKDFDRTINILEKLVSSLGGAEAVIAEQPKLATDLASTFMNRGNARHDQQDFVGATKDIDRAINILEKLVSSLGGEEVVIAEQPQLANELARTFMNRGVNRPDQRDFTGAVKDIDRAINILEKLVSSLGGAEAVIAKQPQLANELAIAFMNRGTTRLDLQDFAGAVNDYDRAIGLLEKLVGSLGGAEAVIAKQPQLANDLACTFMSRGNAHLDDYLRASGDFLLAVEMFEKLLPHQTHSVLVELLHCYRILNQFSDHLNDDKSVHQGLPWATSRVGGAALGLISKIIENSLPSTIGRLFLDPISHWQPRMDDKSFDVSIAKKAVSAVLYVFGAAGESMCTAAIRKRSQWLLKLCDDPARRSLIVASEHFAKWDHVVRLLRN